MGRGLTGSEAEVIPGELIAGRYRSIEPLGSGGVGEVLLVYDEATHEQRALKRLLRSTDERTRELLEGTLRREYAILAQFAHPHVIEVFDFGWDDGRAFYTMEHLLGVHPGDGGPMPWRDVCRMLVTLCGPLALLHARGWVHRDLSPRNVFLVDGAQPKLLDFGAMAALDEVHAPMGATPCLAPETLRRERIDARTDLYGLGALAYFALTGRHAYPAADLAHLSLLWRDPLPRPRELMEEIPEALDELILSLLSLDMQARPHQLAEVVARLSAVAELPDDGASTLVQACLTTPGLVGREAELEQLKRLLLLAAEGRATCSIVRGPNGSGRTRLLDALAVEAEVRGLRVLRAEAALSGQRPYGLAHELGRAAEAGEELEQAALRFEQDPRDELLAQQLQAAFYKTAERWGSRAQPALIIVDDCDLADPESLKLLSGLRRSPASPWLSLALSLRAERRELPRAIAAWERDAELIELGPLAAAQIEQLLRALFGAVPNLTRLSHWLQQHSDRFPGACMLAARELVERGHARFVSGSWQLPDTLDDVQLSAAEQAALDRKLAALSPPARALLELLALVTEPAPLPTSHYRGALQLPEASVAIAEGELLAEHVLVAHDGGYTVRDRTLLLRAREHRLAPELQALHARLGHFYAKEGRALYAAYHLWQAKLTSEADYQIDDALNIAGISGDLTGGFSYSRAVRELYEGLLAYRKQRGAAPLELYPLRMALLTIASMNDASCAIYVPETIAQLRFDVGLDLLDRAQGEPTMKQVLKGLARAQERYDALAPSERGLAPHAAIKNLAQAVAMLAGVFAVIYDAENLSWLPGLITPLRSLSPALEWVASLAEQTASVVILDADCHETNLRILGLTEHALPGVTDSLRQSSRLLVQYYLGMQEAQEGLDRALERAAQLQAVPTYQALGLSVLRMHALAHGRFDEAQRLRRQRELVPWHSVSSEHHLQLGLLRESGTMFDCHDLLELTRIGIVMRELGSRFPGWQPWAAVCLAFRHLVADEPAAALAVCKEALEKLTPFGHGAFQHLVSSKAWALVELQLYAEAERTAREVIMEIERRGLRIDRPYLLETVLAVAEAGSGAGQSAVARLHALLERTEARLGRDVVAYGRLCEARCRVALLLGDALGFFEYLTRMQQVYSQHPSLRAQHARWERAGFERFARPAQRQSENSWSRRIAHALSLHALEQHGEYLLSIVLDELDVDAGQLLRAGERETLQLMASRPSAPDAALLTAAQARWKSWESDSDCETMIGDARLELRDSQGRRYSALWLNHADVRQRPVGLLLLACGPERLGQLSHALLRAISQHLT